MNRVQLIGDLVWPVDLWRDRVTGRAFGKAILAVWRDESGLAFVPLLLKDKDALDAAKHLGEGSRLEVAGHLHTALVTDRHTTEGKRTRRVVRVVADRVTYLTVRPPRSGDRP